LAQLITALAQDKNNRYPICRNRSGNCENIASDNTDGTHDSVNRFVEGHSLTHSRRKSHSEEGMVGSSTSPQHVSPDKKERQRFFAFLIIDSMFSKLFVLTRLVYDFIVFSRPVRLLHLLRSEARNHVLPGGQGIRFIDLGLIIKLLFVCYIFAINMKVRPTKVGHVGEVDQDDIETLFWARYRVTIFLLCASVMYALQTGIVQFVYDVLIKKDGFGRIWRNEDIFKNCDNHEKTEDKMSGDDDQRSKSYAGNPSSQNDRDANSLRVVRRGRRDRMTHGDQTLEQDNIDVTTHVNRLEQCDYEENVHLPVAVHVNDATKIVAGLKRIFKNTFIVGAIHRRKISQTLVDNCEHVVRSGSGLKNNEILKDTNIDEVDVGVFTQIDNDVRSKNHFRHLETLCDFIMDIIYIFGSLLFSLLPMWRPWMVEVLPQESNEENDSCNNDKGSIGDN